ncbi:sn-glycerol-3-phosphate ABC transporter ATP-binding protein UgpC [Pseudooceanicola sp. 216_PA32_1]|jgi:sn-glycerol 3-phosphate transport system ATP-binding protein|uniref:sn-glycerol-3-phosphate ABC transporter ATP-binding protein UgpC n=1 Tax=Pseudooceanicola pacificus TaxID=2676438 RepID=A0A844VYQ2_9RHOB|nr:sn-glycerol-3-phosphate ABC transporter ATP-binding protein UgpC [Pseudooceanicola pacificus]MWB76876.1 sn-glycerol-3-phosphate ABC transporter ATP-binding protein UgpC [Pseudooceanicola pacificus]
MSDITIRDVRKSYAGTEVVHGVNLDIRHGEFIVMLGPSGCGKSTLLRMIAGLEEITSGEVQIGDRVVNRLEPRERNCAMVFQNYALYPHMTVANNIGYALKVAGMKKAERLEKVAAVAQTVGLGEFLDRKPGQLSGGQRQRVAMARAIIREPGVFLFDEPLSNLDAKLRVQMRHEIRRIHNRIGATSVFVTHDQVEGMTLADRLVIMNRGTIEQVGTPQEVYDRPASTYVAGFIGSPAMNFLPATLAEGPVLWLATGERVDLRGVMEMPRGLAPRAMLQLGLRPERLRIGPVGSGAMDVRFEFAEELGSGRLYHLRHEDVPVTVVSETKQTLREGEPVGLTLLPGAVHLFYGETGRRIETTLRSSVNERVSA